MPDDFGMGFTSLGYLTRFPTNCIKIDKSFIQCVEEGGAERQIVDEDCDRLLRDGAIGLNRADGSAASGKLGLIRAS